MAVTTDFSAWLDCADLDNYEDVYCLYRSVEECSEYGMFNTQVAKGKNNGWIVSASLLDDYSLHLCSQAAKDAFLSKIENRYCDGMSMEGWYAYHHAMEKDD